MLNGRIRNVNWRCVTFHSKMSPCPACIIVTAADIDILYNYLQNLCSFLVGHFKSQAFISMYIYVYICVCARARVCVRML